MSETDFIEKTLRNWSTLNAVIVDADLKTSEELLAGEVAGKNRKQFVLRIHSRINRLRAHLERENILKRFLDGKDD